MTDELHLPVRTVNRFFLGQIVVTPGIMDALGGAGLGTLAPFIRKHSSCDWGEVDAHDALANNAAVQDGGRLHSAWTLASGVRIWIITEADRSATTLLLPDEY